MAVKILSAKRKAILEYIEAFTAEKGYAPSVREIGEAVGLSSPSTVHSHIKILREHGYLAMSSGKTRTLGLTGRSGCRMVPLLGSVRAGMPTLAVEETMGFIPYDGTAAPDGLFALKVKGDSMKNAAILENDIVIVRRQSSADNGKIVVAIIDDEATVKRLKLEKDMVWLMPENPDYPPIDGRQALILGVVVAVYRYDV